MILPVRATNKTMRSGQSSRKAEDFSRFDYEPPRHLAAYADNWYFVAR